MEAKAKTLHEYGLGSRVFKSIYTMLKCWNLAIVALGIMHGLPSIVDVLLQRRKQVVLKTSSSFYCIGVNQN